MSHSIRGFAIVSGLPVPLITLAATRGGLWVVAAVLYITLVAFALDELWSPARREETRHREQIAADRLSVFLALFHFALVGLTVMALAGETGLSLIERVGVFIAAGQYFGQVSNSNAHELIHRGDKRLFALGKWVYISLLFGHHTSSHLKVHHRFVASERDPNSARDGESFYSFWPRAWVGSFRQGLRAENADRARGKAKGLHPYLTYGAGTLVMLAIAAWLAGAGGLAAYVLIAAYAQMQLLLSDYVQHYGLARKTLATGKLEPVTPGHSWNAPHRFTARLMLNASLHSDHHAHPARRYPELSLPGPGQAPMLPHSLPAMATLAMLPRLWRRVMSRELSAWRAHSHPG